MDRYFYKCSALIALAIVLTAITIYFSPFPQPASYNDFADTRSFLGIPNAENVLSNIFFVIVGLLGIFSLSRPVSHLKISFIEYRDRRFYLLFFIALFFVGFGSAYYHWAPRNWPLVWDRVPIAIATIALFAAILAERVSFRAANILLWPLVVFGVFGVFYWYYSTLAGPENIALYALIQIYAAFAIMLILILFKSPYSGTKYLWLALLFYAAGRVFEFLDRSTYQWTGHIVSGHTLKHLLMAVSCFLVYWYLRQR